MCITQQLRPFVTLKDPTLSKSDCVITCSVHLDVLQLLLTGHHPDHHLTVELLGASQAPHHGPRHPQQAQTGHLPFCNTLWKE